MSWEEHVARTGDKCIQLLVGKSEEKRQLGKDSGADERIILK
jgi:hypothetical protein